MNGQPCLSRFAMSLLAFGLTVGLLPSPLSSQPIDCFGNDLEYTQTGDGIDEFGICGGFRGWGRAAGGARSTRWTPRAATPTSGAAR